MHSGEPKAHEICAQNDIVANLASTEFRCSRFGVSAIMKSGVRRGGLARAGRILWKDY